MITGQKYRNLLQVGTVILLISAFPAVLPADYNDVVDGLMEEKEASRGPSIFLLLQAADLLAPDAGTADALPYLREQGYSYVPEGDTGPIRLGVFSHLLMKAFEIPGGLMYTLFPGPRYAVRELKFKGFISGTPDTYRAVSGEEVLKIIGRVLSWKEAKQ